jgi:hypothetical protein
MKRLSWLLILIVTACSGGLAPSANYGTARPIDSSKEVSPPAATSPPSDDASDAGPTDDVLELRIATNISVRVSESPEEMLKMCDELIRYVNRLPNVKMMNRMDCLMRSNEIMTFSDEETIASQKFKKDRNGKYRFKDAVAAVKIVATAASKY